MPDIKSKHLDSSRQFYVNVLGLEVAMDIGFIVTLVSPSNLPSGARAVRHHVWSHPNGPHQLYTRTRPSSRHPALGSFEPSLILAAKIA